MPYGQCVEDGKDEDYIFHDKEYSTEVRQTVLLLLKSIILVQS